MSKSIQIVSNLTDILELDAKNIIVCFDVELQNILKQKKIKYLSSLDILKTTDYKEINNLAYKIRNNFLNKLEDIDQIKYSKSLNNLFSFHLRYYVNFLAIQLVLFKKITKKYKPKIIKISSSSDKKSIIKNDIIFLFLLKDYLRKNKIKIISKIQKENKKKNNFSILKCLLHIILNYSMRIFNNIFYNTKKSILVLSPDYGLDCFVKKIIKKYNKYSAMFLEYSYFSDLNNIFFNRIYYYFSYQQKIENKEKKKILNFYKKKIIKNRNIFKFQSYNLTKNVLDYFQLFLADEIIRFSKKINSANSYFIKNKPRLIISHNSFLMGHFLAEFAHYNKIPSLVISHGTHTFNKDKKIFSEWKESAKYLMNPLFRYIGAQSPLTETFLLKNNLKKKIIKTGPLIFSHSSKIISNNLIKKKIRKKIILHASTPKEFNSLRPLTFETTEEYIKQINIIIGVIDKIDNFHLIIKFRPTKRLNYETFRESLITSKNYTISIKESLGSLLEKSDCLISYSSTVIEEMLNHKKPVILFDSFKRYCHVSHRNIKNNLKFNLGPINYLTNIFQLEASLISLTNININKFKKNKFWSQFIYPVDKNMNWIKNIKF